MSSSVKALSILSLFSTEHPVWRPEDICRARGMTRATGYRYIKELMDFGLLNKVAAGSYSLGPRIIELDFQLRQTDPVLIAADSVMHELSHATGREIVLTVLINRRHVIDTHRVHARNPITTSVARNRGRQRPMFRSGAPKILLAFLPRHQQRHIHEQHADEILAEGMGASWEEFRARLDGIRKEGFYMSWGELEPGVGAAVVPVFNPEGDCVAALNLLDSPDNIRGANAEEIKKLLEDASWKIRQRQAYTSSHAVHPKATRTPEGAPAPS
jgi:DNA-binding IclR family transcriptional regulator